jgi:hypothetical protein
MEKLEWKSSHNSPVGTLASAKRKIVLLNPIIK